MYSVCDFHVYQLVGVACKLVGDSVVKSKCPGIDFRKVGNYVVSTTTLHESDSGIT